MSATAPTGCKSGTDATLYWNTGTTETPVWCLHEGMEGDLTMGLTWDKIEFNLRRPNAQLKEYMIDKGDLNVTGQTAHDHSYAGNIPLDDQIKTTSNLSGGVQGGISNGEDIYFNVAFKPVATIIPKQESVDTEGNRTVVEGKGRHDPCVVPRAVPIVESMAAIVILDHLLINQGTKLENLK